MKVIDLINTLVKLSPDAEVFVKKVDMKFLDKVFKETPAQITNVTWNDEGVYIESDNE